MAALTGMEVADLAASTVRELNQALHAPRPAASWRVLNPEVPTASPADSRTR